MIDTSEQLQRCESQQRHQHRCFAFLVRSVWTESFPGCTPFLAPWLMLRRVKPPPLTVAERQHAWHTAVHLQTTSSTGLTTSNPLLLGYFCVRNYGLYWNWRREEQLSKCTAFNISAHVAARCLTVPHFQLIQTFEESSGAICHGQRPAEFNAGSLAHFRLYFRLSHNDDWWWLLWSAGEKSFPCGINTVSSPTDCTVAPPAPQGEHFLTWAGQLPSLAPYRSFPRRPEQWFPTSGPRTPSRSPTRFSSSTEMCIYNYKCNCLGSSM